MPKRRVLKNRNEKQVEQPHQQEQHVEEEEQQQSTTSTSNEPQQPPRKISQFLNGQQKEYHYLTTVNSCEELDKFRFKVNAKINLTLILIIKSF
jgi:hypothetical protein